MGASRKPIPFRSPHRAPAQRQMREIEEMRASMPLGTYIEMMHIAAVTGVVPVLDPTTGLPAIAVATVVDPETGEDKQQIFMRGANCLDGDARIKLMQYLVDKIMPDIKQADPATRESPAQLIEAIAEDPTTTHHLTGEELNNAIQEAVFYMPKIDPPPNKANE